MRQQPDRGREVPGYASPSSMTLALSPRPSRLLPLALLATVLYGAATLYYLRPIWEVFANSLTPNAGDPLFSVVVLKWVVRQIHLGFPDLWNANFFFPARDVLAMSDHMLGPAFEIALIENPIAGYNLLVFSSFVLCGAGTFWVLRRSGLSGPAALIGGAVFAFSPFRRSHLNHLLMLTMQWIPLTLWSFDRLLAERTVRRGVIFLLFWSLQATAGCYIAYMINFPMLVILANRSASGGWRRLLAPASLRLLAPIGALAATVTVLLFLPYVRLAHRVDMTHHDDEIAAGGAALTSYLSPAPSSLYSFPPPPRRRDLPLWRQLLFERSENALFPGYLPIIAAGYGLWEIRRRYRRPAAGAGQGLASTPGLAPRRRALLCFLGAAAVVAFALGDLYTLGFAGHLRPLAPFSAPTASTVLGVALLGCSGLRAGLRWRWTRSWRWSWGEMDPWHRALILTGALSFFLSFPVIYFPLMHVVPGLQSMRVPARFDVFVSLSLAFLAAWGLDRLADRMGGFRVWRWLPPAHRRQALMIAVAGGWLTVGAALAFELAPPPVHWVEVLSEDEFPDVYHWIHGRPEIRSLVEVPLRPGWKETAYMYYSTLHWKPIVNGYSSFVPAGYESLAPKMRLLPDDDGFDDLQRLGVSHLVVHSDLLVRSAPHEADDVANDARGAAMVRLWERSFLGRRIERIYAGDPDFVYRLIPVAKAGPPASPAATGPASAMAGVIHGSP
jgi:hypothetical protein